MPGKHDPCGSHCESVLVYVYRSTCIVYIQRCLYTYRIESILSSELIICCMSERNQILLLSTHSEQGLEKKRKAKTILQTFAVLEM